MVICGNDYDSGEGGENWPSPLSAVKSGVTRNGVHKVLVWSAWRLIPGVGSVLMLMLVQDIRRWHAIPLDWFFDAAWPYIRVFYTPPPADSIVDGPIPLPTVIILWIWFIAVPFLAGACAGSLARRVPKQ